MASEASISFGPGMLSVISYCVAIVVYIALFWFYKPLEVTKTVTEPKRYRRARRTKPINSILSLLGLNTEEVSYCIPFGDKFDTYDALCKAMQRAGLEKARLIIGVDFTASNEWQGRKSFSGNSLHRISNKMNPYQRVISILGQTLDQFDTENKIAAYGFGDSATRDVDIFNLQEEETGCQGFEEVLHCYSNMAKRVILSGPTSFAPLINEAIRIAKHSKEYHVVVIIADGQVTEEQSTIDSIVEASRYPLSIIIVGVGDGPWDMMDEFDNELPKRQFDNFQFVNFHCTYKGKNPDLTFALNALMEIPDQYKTIKSLGYLKSGTKHLAKDTAV